MKGSLVSTAKQAQEMLQTVADHGIEVQTNPFFGLHNITKLLDFVHAGKMVGKGLIVVDEDEQKRVKDSLSRKV